MPNTVHYIIGARNNPGFQVAYIFQSTKLTAAIISLSFFIADQEHS